MDKRRENPSEWHRIVRLEIITLLLLYIIMSGHEGEGKSFSTSTISA